MPTLDELEAQLNDTNLSQQEREAVADEILSMVDKTPPKSAVITETAVRGAADDIMNLLPATGNMLASGGAFLQTLAGGNMPFTDAFREAYPQNVSEQQQVGPARLLRAAPAPTTFGVQAAVETAASPFATTFEQNRDRIVEDFLAQREQAPLRSAVGDVLGDAASLTITRSPFQRGLRNRRHMTPDISFGAARKAERIESVTPGMFEGLSNLSKSAINSRLVDLAKRSGIRLGESGLDGAMLAAMNDDDPLTGAAIGAGAQALGGPAIWGVKGLLGNKGANLAVAAAGTMSFIQLFKESTPGGRDRILESSESAFAKLAALMMLAGLGAAAGSGRIQGRVQQQAPEIADMLTAMPRGQMVSILSDMLEDDSGEMELVLGQLQQDPSYFGPTAQRRFERALTVDGAPTLNEQIQLLKADRRFKRRLDALINEASKQTGAERLYENTPTIPIGGGVHTFNEQGQPQQAPPGFDPFRR